MLTHDQFLADVAAVYIRQDGNGSFGSGRLIAPDLVLTAGHVVDYQTREDSTRSGWKICLLRDRKEDGSWSDPAYEAEVIWRGSGELDLALLQVGGGNNLKPWLKPIFASYALHRPVGDVDAAGFPGAWAPREVPRDYSVRGSMRLASQHGPYAWDVAVADKPDDPHGWKGMSGSALCRIGEDDKLYLFGVVQEVPANFSCGLLEVARISHAFEDSDFCQRLETALKAPPAIIDFRLPQSRADLGITRTFESLTQKFRKEYLVSGSGPVPFGGRDSELARFDAWLFDPKAAPRMLVTAPAGRGKSALLVQWLKNLQDGGVCGPDGWQLAFMPISIRIGTNRPEVFYEGLARRLAEILGETLPTDAIRETSGFRYAVHNLLDRIADAAKQRVLVVIDGLDEALEGTFDADVFPKILPMNIRVVLSARWQFGDHDSRGWLERLRWDRGAPVETFELDRLDTKGIADVLVKLGAPLDVAAKDRDLVDRLAELTEGEPLLIRYYAEDLWLQSSTMTRVTRADLDDLKPGFDSYFKRWFELQEKQWNEEHPNLDRQRVDAALSVLAFALGPLRESDFLALMRRIHGVEGLIAVDRLLGPLRRFVFGSGKSDTGFTLSHPRIGEYLQRNRFAAHTSDLQHGFAEWGKAHLKDLNSGLIKPEKASAYLLQSLPEHLKLAKASPEDFMMMVEDGWRRAWEHLEGGHCGFASAVQAAWNALRQDGADPRLSAQWRCALTLSSIKSLGESVPNDLILAAVKTGVITVRQAAYFAQLKEPLDEGVKLLSDLARISHDNPPLAKELMFAAFAAAKVNAAEYLHSDTLAELALPLPPELLDEVIAAAKGLEDRTQRARAMIALAPYLTSTLLAEALAAATAIDNDEDRAEALAALAPHLPPDQKEEALRRSLDAAGAIRDDSDRAKALTTLASQLPAKQKEEALRLALASAATIGDEGRRAWRLAGLAPHLPPERREEALTGSLDAAKAIRDDRQRADTLAALARNLAPKQKEEALRQSLAAATASGDKSSQVRALAALASGTKEQTKEALMQVLHAAATRGFGSNWYFLDNDLADLAILANELTVEQKLTSEQRDEVLHEALKLANTPYEESDRVSALITLAPHLSPQLLGKAVMFSADLEYSMPRVTAFTGLAPYLPPALLSEAFIAAKAIGDEEERFEALAALTSCLAVGERDETLRSALAASKSIRDQEERSDALAELAPLLPTALLDEALTVAAAIYSDRYRAEALTALAPQLPPALLNKARAAGKTIGDEKTRADTLAMLASRLPPKQKNEVLGEALAAAKAIRDKKARADTLAMLASRLPPKQKNEVLGEALAAGKAIRDKKARVDALVMLALHLPPKRKHELISEALAASKAIREKKARVDALVMLAPHLPAKQKNEMIGEALAAGKAIREEITRADTLAILAPQLGPPLLRASLAAVKAIGDVEPRSEAVAALVPYLSPAQRKKALRWALDAAKAIGDAEVRLSALTPLLPHLPPMSLGEVLNIVNSITDEDRRSDMLVTLAPRLSRPLLGKALATAKAMRHGEARSKAIAALAPHLSPKQKEAVLRWALAANMAIDDDSDWLEALVALAPTLSPEQKEEALRNALEAALSIREARRRADALTELADLDLSLSLKKEALLSLIDTTKDLPRRVTLTSVKASASWTLELGGVAAIQQLSRAINEVCRWYR